MNVHTNHPPVPLLEVRGLTVEFATRRGTVRAVEQVDLDVAKGETLAIVGESGSGKSVTSYTVMRILDRAGRIAEGSMTFSGVDLVAASEKQVRALRGREMSMIFQNPRAALNPIRTVGRQIEDVLKEHALAGSADAKEKAIAALTEVRIARPEERYDAYPFELSGGMCQRIVIALALACRPQLLIADEPTTGLDVTTQKAVMDLVMELTRARGMSTLLITHDLGLAAAYCDRVMVMEKGRVVETALAGTIFKAPSHAYTRKLMRATPRGGVTLRDLLPEGSDLTPPEPRPAAATDGTPLLTVTSLVKEYPKKGVGLTLARLMGRGTDEDLTPFRAVDGISFAVGRGESLGLVGESGCGKSTTSMMVNRLTDRTSGSLVFDGIDIGAIPARQFARSPLRRRIQMVFQDPTDSLNPRFQVGRAIADPILRMGTPMNGAALKARVEELARLVGFPEHLLDRFPHQLSGGQKARVGIARAIALDPDLVILDEPTAALDVSVQAVVLNLLQDLKIKLGMSYIFVSHDLEVVRLLCDRVVVMRAGRIVEQGMTREVLSNPQDPYTRELLSSIPHPPV
ncbi:dipeptide ABC transporter ATP-binding protein [Methylobrevis pamukkalensis]|uniref:Glutathione import ATP-binding protein GsiA n=1 Tax=Methylobrevis pamukkalensis TaxID=1439726 RepID=A0A1E3H625_9HYPH|nr:ABC transporter ATP-binding protein [Methylobrevis pamukkalensis]ODN71789.1 Glutathione import ATP-binding protein GsiA [Methylobrevis pamukkalensis]